MKKMSNDNGVVNAQDLSILTDKYENKWVALSKDYKKILAVGSNLLDVLRVKDPDKVVIKVLPNLGYAPKTF